jgi:hypothetical protein
MMRAGQLDVRQLSDRGVAELWELIEGQKKFRRIDHEPKAMASNVSDLNRRSVLPRLCGFRLHAL